MQDAVYNPLFFKIYGDTLSQILETVVALERKERLNAPSMGFIWDSFHAPEAPAEYRILIGETGIEIVPISPRAERFLREAFAQLEISWTASSASSLQISGLLTDSQQY